MSETDAQSAPEAAVPERDLSRERVRGRSWVRLTDRLAEGVITLGGLAVLAAMLGICVFLVMSAAPLFRGGEVEAELGARAGVVAGATPAEVWVANTREVAIVMDDAGVLHLVRLGDGAVLGARPLAPEGRRVTAWSRIAGPEGVVALGFDDGTFSVLDIGLRRDAVRLDELPESVRARLGDGGTGGSGPAVVRGLGPGEREQIGRTLRTGGPTGPETAVVCDDEGAVVWTAAVRGGGALTIEGAPASAVAAIDINGVSVRRRFVPVLLEDGSAWFGVLSSRQRLDGGDPVVTARTFAMSLTPDEQEGAPRWLFVSADGASVYALWPDAPGERLDASNPRAGFPVVETIPYGEHTLTAAKMTLGGTTLVLGDEGGRIGTVFTVPAPVGGSADARRTILTEPVPVLDSPVTMLAPSNRTRAVLFGGGDGGFGMMDLTSGKLVVSVDAGDGPAGGAGAGAGAGAAAGAGTGTISAGGMPLANNAAAVFDASGGYRAVEIEPGHPEVGGRVLFGKMHYEGYARPEYVYQSTGTAASEPKYSLVPLIFGTIKATVFAMLFATPLAVLAAVYTSEFLHPSLRKIVKPSVELMASLPSVVLGFVAAVVAAPLIRAWLPGVLVGFLVVPLAVVLAGLLWQMLPVAVVRRDRKYLRLAMVGVVLAIAGWVASGVGGMAERALFVPTPGERLVAAGSFTEAEASRVPGWVGSLSRVSLQDQRRLRSMGLHLAEVDGRRALVEPVPGGEMVPAEPGEIRAWLDGAIGGAFPGWFLLMSPVGFGAVWLGRSVLTGRRWASFTGSLGHGAAAGAELSRFAASVALAMAATALLAWAMTAAGLDSRDSLFGTFTQRNTLVVGLIMGFAVVPIIFTISEDAMSSVPASLRTASLGAGATRWQTAMRVVMPVAGSGIFSACMIGLGRAVGETMIVLMATGNTPELSWNIFGGFRTLAANIAYELPEAPSQGTHYRVLFLCGLVLFAMTLVINTTAELVRQRFRKRNAAL